MLKVGGSAAIFSIQTCFTHFGEEVNFISVRYHAKPSVTLACRERVSVIKLFVRGDVV